MQANLGLVCITRSDEVRFRTITRTRYLAKTVSERRQALEDLYAHNLDKLFHALAFCSENAIKLYRMSANLFPLSDWEDGVGLSVLEGMSEQLARFGEKARQLGVRVVVHPDQFVVLSSEKENVVKNSVAILEHQAKLMDMLGLERSSWAAMNIHGGKRGRADALADVIGMLSSAVRTRLTLENDERCYGAELMLDICQRAGIPMVFDAHHHLVRENLSSYDDPSITEFVHAARETWTPETWQIVHLSNGQRDLWDNKHSDFISQFPTSFRELEWVEIEAKAKEEAIFALRESELQVKL